MLAAMLQRFVALSIFLAVLSVGIGGFAGKTGGEAEVATDEAGAAADDAGPWFRKEKGRQGSSIPAANGGEVRLDREADTHFYANVTVNGTDIRMMVDSGASMIALTRADAEAMGINVEALPELGSANTAGGVVPIRPLTLDRVSINGLEVVGVQAAIIDADMSASLLGQSYLSRLQSVRVEGDVMTLR